jgi:hypothetical protein
MRFQTHGAQHEKTAAHHGELELTLAPTPQTQKMIENVFTAEKRN